MKVIFFGLGSIGKKHVEMLKELYPSVSLYSYQSNNPIEGVKNLSSLDRRWFDAAFICNPTSEHMETILFCIDRNIENIFVEKPLSDHIDNYEESILDDFVSRRGNIYIAHNLRFEPTLLKLRELLSEKFDDIFYVDIIHSVYMPNWRKYDYKNCYSAKNEMGGGVILDMSHEFDYIQWIFGEIEVWLGMQGIISELEISSEDYCDLLFGIKDTKITGRLHLDYFGNNLKRKINIHLSNIQITADLVDQTIKIYEHSGLCTKTLINPSDLQGENKYPFNYTYREQMKYFMNAAENKKNISNLRENINLIKKLIEIKEGKI